MQFLLAAAMQARSAAEIEASSSETTPEDVRVAHKGLVTGAILQASASLECEIYEVMVYGPGHHLGSSGIDVVARDFLGPLADMIDGEGVLERYATVLHLLKKPPLDRGRAPWQEAKLTVQLRNELVHYKSRWNDELEQKNLIRALKQKGHRKPPYLKNNANFFPHECLNADCAAWAVRSMVRFLDSFYEILEMPQRLDPYRARLQA